MELSLMSSHHTLAVQSPTLKKYLGKNGLRVSALTGPWCPGNVTDILSEGSLALRLQLNESHKYNSEFSKYHLNSSFVYVSR